MERLACKPISLRVRAQSRMQAAKERGTPFQSFLHASYQCTSTGLHALEAAALSLWMAINRLDDITVDEAMMTLIIRCRTLSMNQLVVPSPLSHSNCLPGIATRARNSPCIRSTISCPLLSSETATKIASINLVSSRVTRSLIAGCDTCSGLWLLQSGNWNAALRI